MNPKQLKEQKLKEILMEMDDYDLDDIMDEFEITGGETDEEISGIALSYHIDQIHKEEGYLDQEDGFKSDKFDNF